MKQIKKKLITHRQILIKNLKRRNYREVLRILTNYCLQYNLPLTEYDRTFFTPYTTDCQKIFNLADYVNCSIIKINSYRYLAASKPVSKNIDAFIQLVKNSKTDIIISCINNLNYTDNFNLIKSVPITFNNKVLFFDEDFDTSFSKLKILRFTNWVDHDVLSHEEMQFFFDYYTKMKYFNMLIHCTAGVGRTGVVIAYDFLKKYQYVDESILIDTLIDLRSCRNGLVFSQAQLKFLVEVFVYKPKHIL